MLRLALLCCAVSRHCGCPSHWDGGKKAVVFGFQYIFLHSVVLVIMFRFYTQGVDGTWEKP